VAESGPLSKREKQAESKNDIKTQAGDAGQNDAKHLQHISRKIILAGPEPKTIHSQAAVIREAE
jgi:hypothetical protein